MRFLNLIGYLAGCFTNYDEVQFNRPDGFGIYSKGFEIQSARESLYFRDSIQDIFNAFFPISRGHRHILPKL